MTRWGLILQQYDLQVRYKKGTTNTNADALSRSPVLNNSGEINVIEVEDISPLQRSQKADPDCKAFIEFLELGKLPDEEALIRHVIAEHQKFIIKNGTLLRMNEKHQPDRVVLPKAMMSEILEAYHAELFSAHLGYRKTLEKLKVHYYWRNMASDTYKYCQECLSCAGRKSVVPKERAPLISIPVEAVPFTKVSVDLLNPFPTSESGNKYILVFMDMFTKWPEAFALADMKAETVAKVFVEEIVCRFGAPKILLSDCGTNFVSGLMYEITRLCTPAN